MLQVIPVLDLLDGHVVRGIKGERSAYRPIVSQLAPGSEPRVLARALLQRCASTARPAPLYVADLDAIQGRAPQSAVLAELLAELPEVALWLDAGFADLQAARSVRAGLGASGVRTRAVFGS